MAEYHQKPDQCLNWGYAVYIVDRSARVTITNHKTRTKFVDDSNLNHTLLCYTDTKSQRFGPMTHSLRLLILDEDANKVKQLAASLSSDGVVAYSTTDPDEACQLISLLQHDVMLIGVEKLIRMPVYPLQAFRQARPDLRIVGISRGRPGDTGLLLDMLDLDAYLREPVTPEALIIALPDIADRYLMVTVRSQLQSSRDNNSRQKWSRNLLPFVGRRHSSPLH